MAIAACGSAAPGAATPAGSIIAGSPGAVQQCAAITSCDACTAQPACRFCTEPRGCVAAGGECGGLALADATTCINDPATGGSARARGMSMIHASLLAQLRDMTPQGPALEARLEKLASVSFPVSAGRCYALVWSTAEDARLADATAQLDFVGPKGPQGSMIIELTPSGWSGRACTSVAGTITLTVVDSETYSHLVPAGTGKIAFVMYGRPRTPGDSDEGGGPPILAPDAPTGAHPSSRATPGGAVERGSVGVDCQDCTFPCESTRRDCERRCFVDEREEGSRRVCERTCEQIERACLRGCPGCW